MNSNILAFSEPREASQSAMNLRAFSEVNNDGDEAAFAGIPVRVLAAVIALNTTIEVRRIAPTVVAKNYSIW